MTERTDKTRGERRQIRRRQLLTALGAGAGVLLAGCLGGGGDDDTPTETSTPTATETTVQQTPAETDTPTPEPAETDTPTQTETATPENSLPVTGEEVPELAVFDRTMMEYMSDLAIEAGALGVAKDGETVLERGYGWTDPEETEPLNPETLFRIGSISKPITDAAIRHLIEAGELALEDRVLPLLDVDAPAGEPADDRFEAVRVEHLLRHEGGWDQRTAGDPLYQPVEIAETLDLDGPPDKYDVTRYMLDQPMQFDPGERSVYSNFGYSLLGQVIEGVTGSSYQAFLEAEIFGPEGIEGIEIGRTRPEDRHPDEVWYDDQETCPNAFDLESDDSGPCADVGFVVEAFDAAGGHIASTASLLSYLDAYWLSGEPRDERALEYRYFGSHPGSFALARQYPDGVDVVALFNRRELPLDRSTRIESMLGEAVGQISEWP